MNAELFQKIVELLVGVLCLILSCYVIPYIKAKLSQAELDELTEYVNFGVRCAEMYFNTDQGKEKKEFVMNYIKDVIQTKLHIEITDDMLDHIVESIVHEVKYGKVSDSTTTE